MGISRRVLRLSLGLTLTIASFAGCQTKLPPNDPIEGRPCILGVVPPSQVDQVRVWAEGAHSGDLLVSPACDEVDVTRLLNEIRRNTR
jgi:hypothetical protein